MLLRKEIRELENTHGKHNFCYQCGNPNILPTGESYTYSADGSPAMCCPKCGSSDLDE